MFDRFLFSALRGQGVGQVAVGGGKTGVGVDGPLKLSRRFVDSTLFGQLAAAKVLGFGPVAVD